METLRRAKMFTEKVVPEVIVLLPATHAKLATLYETWTKEARERDLAEGEQNVASLKVNDCANALRTYISHFLQVFNMAIERGEHKPGERSYFQLPNSQSNLPSLGGEPQLMTWAARLIKGEAERVNAGLAPMSKPDITAVEAKFNEFKQASDERDQARTKATQEGADVQALRAEVDDFIRNDLWYEILGAMRREEPAKLRNKARAWGVRYQFQKGETPLEGEVVDSEGKDIVADD